MRSPYSWVEGEAYEINLVTNTGATFAAEIPVALLTPGFSAETFFRYALIGTYVGVIPVALGLLWIRSFAVSAGRGWASSSP